MTASSRLRPLTGADTAAVTALNDAEVPRVGYLGAGGLEALLVHADLALVAERSGQVVGFAIAIAPGAAYTSPNYRYFEARGSDHLYLDRIAVAASARRQGVAGALWDAVEDRARKCGRTEVTCEVNVRPPNPGSLAFHLGRGFVEVGRQDTSSEVTVALLAKPVTPGGGAP
ncbi:MAG: GNAT family N-acetyltransferase [Nitriliruptoraceae bacterium]